VHATTVLFDWNSASRTLLGVALNESLAGFNPPRSLESLRIDLEAWLSCVLLCVSSMTRSVVELLLTMTTKHKPTPPDFQRALNPPSSGVFWEEAHATPPGGAQDSAHLQHKLLRAKPLVAIILRKKEGNRYGHGYRIISSNKHLFKIARIKFSINVVYSIVEEIQRNLQILCFRTTHFVLLSFIGEIVCFSGVKESECLGPQSVSILRGFLFGVSFERGLPA
jgi:hypothetical protein